MTPEQLAADLKRAARETDKALAAANRQIGRKARDDMRSAARSGTRLQSEMASGIGTKAGKSSVSITVRGTKGAPGATVAFWGAKRRTGWYAAPRYRESKARQHPTWVGASWQVASKTSGPYVINPTLADKQPDYEAAYLDNVFGTLPPRGRT